MLRTKFLSEQDYSKYGEWLRQQDEETRQMYFGVSSSDGVINELMSKILSRPEDHFFLIALDGDQWVGTLHIATKGLQVEFGLIVDPARRGEGIASMMLEDALTWARNRNYRELFMHCLTWNRPINHLCRKHGLTTRNMMGDSEVAIILDPPTWITLNKEVCIEQRNLFHAFLDKSRALYTEIYG
jgi:GNAT superfamily N-acetyltransferase